MHEDEYLDAVYEDRTCLPDPEPPFFPEDEMTDEELDRDRILEQQELEDFEQCDEYFGASAEDML